VFSLQKSAVSEPEPEQSQPEYYEQPEPQPEQKPEPQPQKIRTSNEIISDFASKYLAEGFLKLLGFTEKEKQKKQQEQEQDFV
jgi:hypothetical protein